MRPAELSGRPATIIRRRHPTAPLAGLAVTFAALCMTGCASLAPAPSPALSPFSTDGCSMFPDRALLGKADWCRCCVEHDLAYWRGGTAEERLKADRQLQACVQQTSGDPALAELMFAGVRVGGGPYFLTSYRWAYGWPAGRNYTPLLPDEQAAAALLANEYLASNPELSCSR